MFYFLGHELDIERSIGQERNHVEQKGSRSLVLVVYTSSLSSTPFVLLYLVSYERHFYAQVYCRNWSGAIS